MTLKTWFRRYVLIASAVLIGILLLANIYLTYQNNLIIERNKSLQEEAEKIKVYTLDMIRNLHLLDMSIRTYALINKPAYSITIDTAHNQRERIFRNLKEALLHQHYPMEEFYSLEDSIIQYFAIVDTMRNYIENNEHEKFIKVLDKDPGYKIWLKYKRFNANVNVFEEHIVQQAKLNYQQALRNIYWLQIILFFISIITLGYTTYYVVRAFRISARYRKSQEKNSNELAGKKTELEKLVNIRTSEIQSQNEKITAQSEEIAAHNELLVMQQREIEMQHDALFQQNEKLKEAKLIIETQNNTIHKQNEILVLEVAKQTRDLKATNLELVEQNSRLEQFTYIISHNIKAPLARLIGLSQIIKHAKSQKEIDDIINMITDSTTDLDQVIKDLAYILDVQQVNTEILSTINLKDVLDKTVERLEKDIKKTKTQIIINLQENIILNSLPEYLDSIFYNLVNNAIKFRHPDRTPVITISAKPEQQFIKIDIQDNGLGIDLIKNADKIFTLYKRFHFHVEGKGLNLYLIKTQIIALGGKIEVKSKVEEGTTFTVYLKKS